MHSSFILIFLSIVCVIAVTTLSAQPRRVLTPNGGERLEAGRPVTLTWTGTTAKDTVRLEYSLDGGATWLKIASRVSDTSYRWIVPDTVSELCLFRVAQVYGESGTTKNARFFSLPINFFRAHYIGDGSRLVGAVTIPGQGAGVAIFNVASTTPEVFMPTGTVSDVALSPDKSFVATFYEFEDSVKVWDVKTGAHLWSRRFNNKLTKEISVK